MSNGQPTSEVMVILKHIDEKIDRLIWRADQQEDKVDEMNKRLTILETKATAKEESLGSKIQEKGALIILGLMLAFFAKKLGIG